MTGVGIPQRKHPIVYYWNYKNDRKNYNLNCKLSNDTCNEHDTGIHNCNCVTRNYYSHHETMGMMIPVRPHERRPIPIIVRHHQRHRRRAMYHRNKLLPKDFKHLLVVVVVEVVVDADPLRPPPHHHHHSKHSIATHLHQPTSRLPHRNHHPRNNNSSNKKRYRY